jgi:hypothetical protein
MKSGCIKDYREELQSDVWAMAPLYHRVWQYLKYSAAERLIRAPMRDGNFSEIAPGQMVTTLRAIAEGVAWYERGILRAPGHRLSKEVLEWLEGQGLIEVGHGSYERQHTVITNFRWSKYQMEGEEKDEKRGIVKEKG